MLFKSSPQPRQTPSPSLQRNTSDLAARLHRSTSDLATRAMRVQEVQAVRVSPAGISEALTIVTPLDAAERHLCGSQAGQLEPSKGFKAMASKALKKQLSGGSSSASAPAIMRSGADSMGIFGAKIGLDRLLWGKAVGDGQQLELSQSLASGALAASAGSCASGSFTAVKNRLPSQQQAGQKGLLGSLASIPPREFAHAACRNIGPRVARAAPAQALLWAASDQLSGFLDSQRAC